MDPTPYVVALHRRAGLPEAAVVRLAERASGGRAAAVRRVVRGHDNEVHRVVLDSGAAVFVRIRRHGEGDVTQEAAAMQQARDAGVPVPAVLAVDPAADLAEGLPVLVVAAAEGRPLVTLAAALSPAERRRALGDLGAVLARLHTVRPPGVWRPDGSGRWPEPDGVRQGFARERRAERRLLRAAGLSGGDCDRALGLLPVAPDPPLSGFVLCHGDVDPDHVFVDRGLRVSGLIDWGMWHSGSPVGELAGVVRCFGWRDLEAVLDGYGDGHGLDPDALPRALATTVVTQLLGHLAHDVTIRDHDAARADADALRDALGRLPS